MADTNHRPILSLETFRPHRVDIDDVSYDMRRRETLPVLELQAFDVDRKVVMALFEKFDANTLTADEATTLSALLDKLTRQVLFAPDEVHRKFGDMQRFEILSTFWMPPRRTETPAGATDPAAASLSIGATSSPGSSGSTAEPIPSAG